jgi:hypothetical protein
MRRELGIGDEEFVVGHVGMFVEAKNHAFLVEIAAACVRREPTTRIVLVGHGQLKGSIEQSVKMAKVARSGSFCGRSF